jgi:hypothetical protein
LIKIHLRVGLMRLNSASRPSPDIFLGREVFATANDSRPLFHSLFRQVNTLTQQPNFATPPNRAATLHTIRATGQSSAAKL